MTRPRPCGRCGVNPVGYRARECCYTCVPRRGGVAPVCKRCGSGDYYTSGLCRRCHRSGPVVDSCRDCLAWGVTRHEKWLCQACRGWRRRHEERTCPSCQRLAAVNERGFCRLCCAQATTLNRLDPAHRTLDVFAVNRRGQQLSFADMILKKHHLRPAADRVANPRRTAWPTGYPVDYAQLVAFDVRRDLSTDVVRRLEPPIPALADALQQAMADHGDRHGWTNPQRERTWRGLRILLAIQDTPGARISFTEANVLLNVEGAFVQPVVEVLASAGMLIDDREPPLEQWFARQVAALPASMQGELAEWFHAHRDGSAKPPRTRPRNIGTVYNSVRIVLPVVRGWAAEGHMSLREITRDDVVAALDASAHRNPTLTPLRSLFRFLKARKIVFVNPTARLRGDRVQRSQPLPIELDVIRDALRSPDPSRAALAALFAFHALRTSQARDLLVTDVRDGRLHVDGNTIVLAEPVRQRLNAWLAERARRWPYTANAHVFLTNRTAVRTMPVSSPWIKTKLGVLPQKIREDRILNEAIATGGDVRRLCDLFGVSVPTAQRYADVITKADETAFSAVRS